MRIAVALLSRTPSGLQRPLGVQTHVRGRRFEALSTIDG
jgi:hypothetical protein